MKIKLRFWMTISWGVIYLAGCSKSDPVGGSSGSQPTSGVLPKKSALDADNSNVADLAGKQDSGNAKLLDDWLEGDALLPFPGDIFKGLSASEVTSFTARALALPVGARRAAKIRAIVQSVSTHQLSLILVPLAHSNVAEDVDLARDFVFTRGHELSPEQLISLAEASGKGIVEDAAIAAAAKISLDTKSFQDALAWATAKNNTELLHSVVESASLGNKWQELLNEPMDRKWWTPLLIDSVARNLGRCHPKGSFSWIENVSSSGAGSNATAAFVGGWLNQEPGEASAWVSSLKSAAQKDAGAAAIAAYCRREGDNDGAKRWAGSISNPQLREATELAVSDKTVGGQ